MYVERGAAEAESRRREEQKVGDHAILGIVWILIHREKCLYVFICVLRFRKPQMMRRRAWRLADKRRITATPEDFLEAFSHCGIRSASALGTVSGGRRAESLQRLVVTV